MKDFQEQSLNLLQTKINELQDENARLKAKMLTESDVKMIVAKAIDSKTPRHGEFDDFSRRKSQSFHEPLSLHVKSGKGRFGVAKGPKNNNLKNSLTNSSNSDDKKDHVFEL